MTSANGDNNSADHWFKEGLRLGKLDDNDSSIKAYQKAVELDPEHFMAWFNMGIRYGKTLTNVKAAECFRKAVALKPEDAMAQYSLALVSNLIGLTDDSVKHYKKAIRINPKFAKAHSNLSVVYYQFKQGREAIESLRSAEKLFDEQGETGKADMARDLMQELYSEFKLTAADFE